jgi:hypothetical protein
MSVSPKLLAYPKSSTAQITCADSSTAHGYLKASSAQLRVRSIDVQELSHDPLSPLDDKLATFFRGGRRPELQTKSVEVLAVSEPIDGLMGSPQLVDLWPTVGQGRRHGWQGWLETVGP